MTAALHRAVDWALQSLLSAGALYFVLFCLTHLVLATTSDGFTAADVLLLLLVCAAQAILLFRGGLQISARQTVIVCALLLAAAVLGLASLPPGHHDGYSIWFFGAITFSLLGLTLVGRYAAAWATLAAVVVVAIAWAVWVGLGPAVGAGLVVRHVATLLIGTALTAALRRSNGTFAVFREVERRRRADERAADARAGARRSAAESVLEQAGPMLRAIAEGRALSDSDRRELLVIEGALRDQIRTPDLTRGRLKESVAAARRRGVNVLLLDEAEHAPPAARERATAWLANELERTEGDRFVGRLRLLEGAVRASAVVPDHSRAATFEDEPVPPAG